MRFQNPTVKARLTVDTGRVVRKWFTGDADYQRAKSECREGEVVFEVWIESRSAYVPGWAIGK